MHRDNLTLGERAIFYQTVFVWSQVNNAKAKGTLSKGNELTGGERVK